MLLAPVRMSAKYLMQTQWIAHNTELWQQRSVLQCLLCGAAPGFRCFALVGSIPPIAPFLVPPAAVPASTPGLALPAIAKR